MSARKFRTEKDSLGLKDIPVEVYYGIQTARAADNFPVSGVTSHSVLIDSYILIKKSAAITNTTLGQLNKNKGNAIIKACNEILKGKFRNHFIVDVFQAGAGTSTNMNVNEVIANRAIEILGGKKGDYSLINPNDHVNMAQSTNDTYPTAMHLACLKITDELLLVIQQLHNSFKKKAKEFNTVIKSGRTHLQDASPITLGQEFSGFAEIIHQHYKIILSSKNNLYKLGIGGTAVGTGLNTHKKFQDLIIRNLSHLTGNRLSKAENNFASMQSMYPFTELSSALKNFCTDLTKIANDLRLLASGPTTGFFEIILPAVQPGSSIMPGKVNPSIVEMLNMVCYQVMGNDHTVTLASQAGQLELNVMMPVISYNILFSLEILKNALRVFDKKCVRGIIANKKKARSYAEQSISIVTALNPVIGYSNASKIAKEAINSGNSILDLIKEKNILTKHQLKQVTNILRLTKPGIIE